MQIGEVTCDHVDQLADARFSLLEGRECRVQQAPEHLRRVLFKALLRDESPTDDEVVDGVFAQTLTLPEPALLAFVDVPARPLLPHQLQLERPPRA
ncbi:MAG: hypothetical protein ABW321_17480 [Polyangiales bacterium]